jgi:ethanolamine permease
VTHGERRTPQRALIAGSALGFAVCVAIQFAGPNSPVGGVLLNMAVFGAVLAYVLQMLSFVLLRINFPHIARPYRSPLGVTGAVIAIVIALLTLVMLFLNPDYRLGVIGAAVWFLCGVAYFGLWARNRLILSPEEEFALAHSQAKQQVTA